MTVHQQNIYQIIFQIAQIIYRDTAVLQDGGLASLKYLRLFAEI